MKPTGVIIIGAGISGLLCATELRKAGKSVCVLDKGRGFGGRMATRRMAGGRLDHGAQFFTVRDSRLQRYVDQWLDAGVIKEWFRHAPDDSSEAGHPRYCGINGITDLPKHLAEGLEVHRSQQVVSVARDVNKWQVQTATGQVYTAEHLVLSAPLPQALSLLDTAGVNYAGADLSELRAVRYDKGLATLAVLDGPSGLPQPGALKVSEGIVTWIADNQMKGISPELPAITIHSDAAFAELHWDSSDEVRGALMLKAAEPYLQANVVEYKCHRWGFTLPVNPLPYAYYHNQSLRLVLIGDAFGGPRVEGAALSGIEGAQVLLQS
ncbi:MAG: FAD-dependent oxidoreductase [Opitutales bacterium]|jgi:renalase|nr:FAD-dependent oxidoreductase [Opitutales bacterium]MDP4642952.1 FAD-dependent oxidoreductase [Opitutales bacterium]MDP4776641.1 FAD-dependent oxidoreductase [Opitutales bacterium]MDP4882802.1 FAD-dependent oxidoreductase [Opitutales bacterium]MDP5078971.1 FAD-dependent oxidoreductase [Opitutales bacterium]